MTLRMAARGREALRIGLVALPMIALSVLANGGENGGEGPKANAEAAGKKSAQESPRKTSKLAVYVPPSRGRAQVRAGGATRALRADVPRIAALAPDHVGLTTRAQPTISWYVSQHTDTRLDFTVIDDEAIDPLVEITLSGPIEAGVHSLRLADLGVRLETDVVYSWFVTLVPDSIRRSSDVMAGGAIQRIAPPPGLEKGLAAASNDFAVYAAEGIWYDAVADLNAAIDAAPEREQLQEQRRAFFEQVGIPQPEIGGE